MVMAEGNRDVVEDCAQVSELARRVCRAYRADYRSAELESAIGELEGFLAEVGTTTGG